MGQIIIGIRGSSPALPQIPIHLTHYLFRAKIAVFDSFVTGV
jgi:hypothetical protein